MFATSKQINYLNALIASSDYTDLHAVKMAYYGAGRFPSSDMTSADASELIAFLKPVATSLVEFNAGDRVNSRLGAGTVEKTFGGSFFVKFDKKSTKARWFEAAELTVA